MEHIVNRYNLRREFLSKGILTIINEEQITYLTYKDSLIEESVSEMYHPLMALTSLRNILENKYESIIGCFGCRIDTAYRPTGGYGTYIITSGQPATQRVNIFEPTDEIIK